MSAALRMIGVQKRFGATHALKGVSFEVAPGTVHALIGENGAGKSTLMKILSGAYQPDAGTIELNGEAFVPQNPLHARRSGIAMIYQELTLAPHLSVEENILLGCEPARFGWIKARDRRKLAQQALAQLHHENIPLHLPVQRLGVAEQQVVEIARALLGNPRVMVMDEPTSSLTRVDAEHLFSVIGRLKARGVSVVYISHFLEECQQICDHYTVLRDGETVGSGPMTGASLSQIIHLMVGREVTDIYPRVPHPVGEPVLTLENLAGSGKPRSVNLTLRQGEILGIAGLVGSGRTETVRSCFGLNPVLSGSVKVNGKESTRASPVKRLRQGMGLLSENRKEEGLMLNQNLADNLTITRFGPVATIGFVNRKQQSLAASSWMEKLNVRARSPEQLIGELSGGNQQKIAIGRLLHHEARILLLDEPTRGIDVASKAEIYRWMGQLAGEGRSILFISSYLPELLGVCDSIAVMCRGVLSEARPAREWTEHSIMSAAIGQNAGGNQN